METTKNEIFSSPVISDVEANQKRLIDTGMLHYESSIAGYNERYHRGETSHTIHVWWARRPHSAMRSLVYSTLCKDTGADAEQIMANIAMMCDGEHVQKAKEKILAGYSETPKLLDMFGGGGTIPFESKRLGIDTYSIDSNQLSVFIQKCNMVYANAVNLSEAEKLVEKIGANILINLKERTNWLFPLRVCRNEETFGYIWSYKTTCPNCRHKFILSKRPWLSKKNGRRIAFVKTIDEQNKDENLVVKQLSDAEEPFSPSWERYTGVLHCPYCQKTLENTDVLSCEDYLAGLISTQKSSGKNYEPVENYAIPDNKIIAQAEREVLLKLQSTLPQSEIPKWSGVVNPAIYGMKTHSDFLNHRQRLVLLYLIDELSTQYDLLEKHSKNMAKFVIGSLSSLVDQVVDWNCRLSMWIPQNEQVGRAFCGPGIAMLWDYAETDQLLNGPANLWTKLKRIVSGVKSFNDCTGNITIEHAHAQQLPFVENFFDAIVTDPPYYDNIYYSILADFFYAWKKILLKKIEPELFNTLITDYDYELVASSRRVANDESPHEKYCEQLNMAFLEAARVIKKDGVFSFVYSHSSVNGWEAVVRAFRQSPFKITSVQPLSIERKSRPRAIMSQAVNTCMTFVARKYDGNKTSTSLAEVLRLAESYSQSFGRLLMKHSGWAEEDAGLAVLACAVGAIANANEVVDTTDFDAILQSAKMVKQFFPSFSIKVRDSI